MLAEKISLKEWRGIYGIKYYSSIMATNLMHKDEEQMVKEDARWVYYFKKYNRNKENVQLMLQTLVEHFCCEDIAVIPSSGAGDINNLQSLFGEKIRRTINVEKRKWGHGKDIPPGYRQSYEIMREKINGNRILLVDDICTTGKTMEHFTNVLNGEGYNIVPVVLGLNIKLKGIKQAETIYIYRQEREESTSDGVFAGIPSVDDLFKESGAKR